ncbi:MAG: HAD-IIIA family hydrolase [Flavobacteriales bacterium]|nr:HAD-IIIA family hydrolase [Flavobacteriales bacterium]
MTYKEKLHKIKTFIFDFDGVLTDGVVYLMPPRDFIRTMHVRDSYAIQYAVKKGYRVAIITGGNSEMVKERMAYLGVTDVFLRASDKLKVFKEYTADHHLDYSEILYIGDDLPDYHVMKQVGLSVCPNDAAEEIRGMVDYVSPRKGGEGVVREMIEQTLKVQGKWFDQNELSW